MLCFHTVSVDSAAERPFSATGPCSRFGPITVGRCQVCPRLKSPGTSNIVRSATCLVQGTIRRSGTTPSGYPALWHGACGCTFAGWCPSLWWPLRASVDMQIAHRRHIGEYGVRVRRISQAGHRRPAQARTPVGRQLRGVASVASRRCERPGCSLTRRNFGTHVASFPCWQVDGRCAQSSLTKHRESPPQSKVCVVCTEQETVPRSNGIRGRNQ